MNKTLILHCLIFFPLILPVSSPAFCYEEAGHLYGVSPKILMTIAAVESNFNPMALNYNRDGSYDIGLMQINSSWRASLGEELWNAIYDPCTNVKIGAWVLADCITRHGDTWEAIGCYNARSDAKRMGYAQKVYRALKRTNRGG